MSDGKSSVIVKDNLSVTSFCFSSNSKVTKASRDAFVTFELLEKQKEVTLKLSLTITEDFPSDIPEFTRDSCQQGWNYFIGERLKEYLEN